MVIDLFNIDEKGRSYCFDESDNEWKKAFLDLVEESAFCVSMEIQPMAGAYRISGGFQSHYRETCSRCGYSIQVPIKNSINEIVVIEKQRPRNTHCSQARRNFDKDEPSVTYINESQLDLKEFLHELIASCLDMFPVCSDSKICQARQYDFKKEEFSMGGHPGFASLKNLKFSG